MRILDCHRRNFVGDFWGRKPQACEGRVAVSQLNSRVLSIRALRALAQGDERATIEGLGCFLIVTGSSSSTREVQLCFSELILGLGLRKKKTKRFLFLQFLSQHCLRLVCAGGNPSTCSQNSISTCADTSTFFLELIIHPILTPPSLIILHHLDMSILSGQDWRCQSTKRWPYASPGIFFL
jgi:hypothetical protein